MTAGLIITGFITLAAMASYILKPWHHAAGIIAGAITSGHCDDDMPQLDMPVAEPWPAGTLRENSQ